MERPSVGLGFWRGLAYAFAVVVLTLALGALLITLGAAVLRFLS